jgi:hypothetical protein
VALVGLLAGYALLLAPMAGVTSELPWLGGLLGVLFGALALRVAWSTGHRPLVAGVLLLLGGLCAVPVRVQEDAAPVRLDRPGTARTESLEALTSVLDHRRPIGPGGTPWFWSLFSRPGTRRIETRVWCPPGVSIGDERCEQAYRVQEVRILPLPVGGTNSGQWLVVPPTRAWIETTNEGQRLRLPGEATAEFGTRKGSYCDEYEQRSSRFGGGYSVCVREHSYNLFELRSMFIAKDGHAVAATGDRGATWALVPARGSEWRLSPWLIPWLVVLAAAIAVSRSRWSGRQRTP